VLQGRLHEAMRTAVAVEDLDDGVNHARGQTVRRGCQLMRALNQLRNPFKGHKPRQHLVYLSVHLSRPCWIGGRPLISMIGLSHDENTFCLYAAPLLVQPRPIE
jgi:hypothetical protein